ncbi:hypothetical protein AJ64_04696 [Pseudomonas aeruginosa 3577]|nr:hypothetical protein AJ64_04696 [Pseudomonas aeruginosa 3577]
MFWRVAGRGGGHRELGEDFFLSSLPVWERPLAIGLSLTL